MVGLPGQIPFEGNSCRSNTLVILSLLVKLMGSLCTSHWVCHAQSRVISPIKWSSVHASRPLDRKRLRFVPEPHLLGRLVWDHVDGVERSQSVALFEDIFLGARWSGLPRKCRGEILVCTGTGVRAIVMVLCCAQACEHVAGVVRIRMPGCDGQRYLQTTIILHPGTQVLTCRAYREDPRRGVGNTKGYIGPIPRG